MNALAPTAATFPHKRSLTTPHYDHITPPVEGKPHGMFSSGVTDDRNIYEQYDVPPHLLAMGRRMTEPGALRSMVSKDDIPARTRQGDGLGNYNQGIPEQNRVFPERILSGE